MKGKPEGVIQIRVIHIVYLVIAVGFFLIGFISNTLISIQVAPGDQTSDLEESCRNFCGFLNNAEFGHVSGEECFCSQANTIADIDNNQTITYTRVLSVGRIRDFKVIPGISQELIDALQQEALRQQQLQQQQQMGSPGYTVTPQQQ